MLTVPLNGDSVGVGADVLVGEIIVGVWTGTVAVGGGFVMLQAPSHRQIDRWNIITNRRCSRIMLSR